MSGRVKQERVRKEPPNDVISSKVKCWLDSLGALEHKLHLRVVSAGDKQPGPFYSESVHHWLWLPPGCGWAENLLDKRTPVSQGNSPGKGQV